MEKIKQTASRWGMALLTAIFAVAAGLIACALSLAVTLIGGFLCIVAGLLLIFAIFGGFAWLLTGAPEAAHVFHQAFWPFLGMLIVISVGIYLRTGLEKNPGIDETPRPTV